MRQTLLFLAGVVGLLSIVPLATWAATGSLQQAWDALKGYLIALFPVWVGVVLGLLVGVIANITGS